MLLHSRAQKLERLDYYHNAITQTILNKQNAASGLMPASVARTSHGDYTDAWVRDNVYSIYAVYGLALAYRRVDDDSGRTFELEHAVIKLMRGLLFAMMRQADKVEKFKQTQDPRDALHAKYNTETGSTVVGDSEWGHLQIDATSLFLVALADMTTSGFTIAYTQDEVDFVQNLVFYIERAYRTPDYGIWERGNKINHGQRELNSSSIGMAVAALRAINGVNLFGARGGPSSIIRVLPDELTRNSTTLHSFLPRESNSKEIDGSVLSVIGFPAFAVDDPDLIIRTRDEATEKLEGKYGWKRFLRDGHQTVLEDTTRLYYNESELKIFENTESEWPLFFTYLVLEGIFNGDVEQVNAYRKKLEPLIIDSSEVPLFGDNNENGMMFDSPLGSPISIQPTNRSSIPLLPELYYVPEGAIDAERQKPHSQTRDPNDNTPLVWALSLYFLGELMYEQLLSPSEVDPLGRRFNVMPRHKRENVVQICLLSENSILQNTLAMYGLETQTLDQIPTSITVLPPQTLTDLYAGLGLNDKLKLSGRPKRPVGILGTSRLYRIQGQIYAFTPHFMDNDEFYINSDPDYLMSAFESELKFTSDNWIYAGRPTVVVLLTNDLLGNIHASQHASVNGITRDMSKKNLLNFFMNLRCGQFNDVRVRLSRLSETINTSNIESLDFLLDKPQVKWEDILCAARSSLAGGSMHRKLAYNESETQANTPGLRTPGNKTPRRKSSAFLGKSLSSPVETRADEGYFSELVTALTKLQSNSPPSFKLKDHAPSPTRKMASHAENNSNGNGTPRHDTIVLPSMTQPNGGLSQSPPSEMLSLVLGDNSQFNAAIESLIASVNLYDQIDLIQYLMSCQSIQYYIEALDATVKELLEEVYFKSMKLHYWSIARQAAGLLHKIVPSLTINITDLVIRQKQVSIGSGEGEYVISMPVAPDALNSMLNEHCIDDVREGPVVQEILIYLGSFIRTRPHMFDGILRLRTHFVIIALREEIRRMNQCDEEEAAEHLMQLSPFELKLLLETVLSGPKISALDDNSIAVRNKTGGFITLSSLGQDKDAKDQGGLEASKAPADQKEMTIRAQSAGFFAGNFAKVEINDYPLQANSRGLHIWTMDRQDHVILEHATYDTHISEEESEECAKFIQSLPSNTIIVIAAKDDISEHLTPAAVLAIESLGSCNIRKVGYRDSFALICEKDNVENVLEAYSSAESGSTEVIEKKVELTPDLSIASNAPVSTETIKYFLPNSSGRWLRRRKNDGALNRVPIHFFPQTWKILDASKGLKIYDHRLPREPTVLEKTPEEFNFALAVEGFLGYYTDPAERQVAVDVLIVISRMLKDADKAHQWARVMIDIPRIMTEAVELFWNTWMSRQKERFSNSPLFEKGYDYATHKDLARTLFYDLPQEGKESTFAYITEAIGHVLVAPSPVTT